MLTAISDFLISTLLIIIHYLAFFVLISIDTPALHQKTYRSRAYKKRSRNVHAPALSLPETTDSFVIIQSVPFSVKIQPHFFESE